LGCDKWKSSSNRRRQQNVLFIHCKAKIIMTNTTNAISTSSSSSSDNKDLQLHQRLNTLRVLHHELMSLSTTTTTTLNVNNNDNNNNKTSSSSHNNGVYTIITTIGCYSLFWSNDCTSTCYTTHTTTVIIRKGYMSIENQWMKSYCHHLRLVIWKKSETNKQ
jgi:triacylglycerol esterase/lipase EstA (alpha/beta hydrolase family)